MSLAAALILGAIAYALAIRLVLRLCRAAPEAPASWSAVPPSAEVLAEMRRHGEVA